MLEKIEDIYDGMKERLKSPFLVTFIIVWCVHHWKLLFLLSTFSDNASQESKFGLAWTYVNDHNGIWGMIGWPLLFSFGSICIYYLVSLVYEGITLLYSVYGRTFINKLDKGKLALKEEVTKLRKRNKRLQLLIQEQQEQLGTASDEKAAYEKYYYDEKNRTSSLQQTLSDTQATLSDSDRKVRELQKKHQEEIDKLKNTADRERLEKINFLFSAKTLYPTLFFPGRWRYTRPGIESVFKIVNDQVVNIGNVEYQLTGFRAERNMHRITFTLHAFDVLSQRQRPSVYVLSVISVNAYSAIMVYDGEPTEVLFEQMDLD